MANKQPNVLVLWGDDIGKRMETSSFNLDRVLEQLQENPASSR